MHLLARGGPQHLAGAMATCVGRRFARQQRSPRNTTRAGQHGQRLFGRGARDAGQHADGRARRELVGAHRHLAERRHGVLAARHQDRGGGETAASAPPEQACNLGRQRAVLACRDRPQRGGAHALVVVVQQGAQRLARNIHAHIAQHACGKAAQHRVGRTGHLQQRGAGADDLCTIARSQPHQQRRGAILRLRTAA